MFFEIQFTCRILEICATLSILRMQFRPELVRFIPKLRHQPCLKPRQFRRSGLPLEPRGGEVSRLRSRKPRSWPKPLSRLLPKPRLSGFPAFAVSMAKTIARMRSATRTFLVPIMFSRQFTARVLATRCPATVRSWS